jgi:hypothetical protein
LNASQARQAVYEQIPPAGNLNPQNIQQQNEGNLPQAKHRKNLLIPVIAVAAVMILLALYFILKQNNSENPLVITNTADSSKNRATRCLAGSILRTCTELFYSSNHTKK